MNLRYLWRLCARICPLTRSGPLPLSPSLWWLIITTITHGNWSGVEARVTVIADVTAHAMDPKLLLSLSLSTSRWWSSRESWWKSRLIWRIWRFSRKSTRIRSKKNTRIIKESKFWWGWRTGLISSFVLRCNKLRLASRILLPEHSQCPRARIKCGGEEVELGYRTNPHANWSLTGFSEEHPSNRITAGRRDVKISTEEALKQHTALEMHIRQQMTSKDCLMRGNCSCKCRLLSVKNLLLP